MVEITVWYLSVLNVNAFTVNAFCKHFLHKKLTHHVNCVVVGASLDREQESAGNYSSLL